MSKNIYENATTKLSRTRSLFLRGWKRLGKILSTIAVNLFLFVLFAWAVYPLIWQFLTSFRTNVDLFANPWGLPTSFSLGNYVKVWNASPLPRYFLNSLIVSATSTVFILLFSSMAAYAFARLKFPGSTILLMFLLSLYFVPPHIALIPLLVMLKRLGLVDTYFALILPYIAFAIPFSTILIRSFILGLPQELIDAALVDGCSKIRLFFSIVLPVIRPILAVVLVVQFVTCWNEYLFALVFLHSREVKTLPVGLLDFVGEYFTDWVATAAGLTLATIPVLIVYLVFRNQIISGMTAGAIKG